MNASTRALMSSPLILSSAFVMLLKINILGKERSDVYTSVNSSCGPKCVRDDALTMGRRLEADRQVGVLH